MKPITSKASNAAMLALAACVMLSPWALSASPDAAPTSPSMSPARTPVPDARPLMLAAIQASDGKAMGVLTSKEAQAITAHFAATSPIYIDVTTQRRYRQPGCSRLKVLFWQEGVRITASMPPRKQTIEFGINYCSDGRPPRSLD
jgi:hypothetical protein